MSSQEYEIVHVFPRLPPRRASSHKGTYGRVLVVAGSRGMSGAAILCAGAALRSGAGLVRLAVPECIFATVAAANPCYTTIPLPEAAGGLSDMAFPAIESHLAVNDVVALGPGLGQSPGATKTAVDLLAQAKIPVVLDADGLNVLPADWKTHVNCQAPLVMTPHPGEFARLLGVENSTVQGNRRALAAGYALDRGVVLVLKGHNTIVTDGCRMYINQTGNPGMATGGTGDVLTGIIAALLGQKMNPFEAAQLGVYVHGLAGDLARQQVGEVSLIATDLLDKLPQAFSRASASAGCQHPAREP